jgi:uncharacterized membrane protein
MVATDTLVALSYVVHVVSAAFWTGGVLYAAYAVFPAARAGELPPAAFERQVDGVLQATRWTGLALPATGAYQLWTLYPLPRLLGTTAGHLVLGMLALWGLMNGLLEAGVYRMRTVDDDRVGIGTHLRERFVLGAGPDTDGHVDVVRRADVGWPYLVGAAALALLLLVDAALLASGLA